MRRKRGGVLTAGEKRGKKDPAKREMRHGIPSNSVASRVCIAADPVAGLIPPPPLSIVITWLYIGAASFDILGLPLFITFIYWGCPLRWQPVKRLK